MKTYSSALREIYYSIKKRNSRFSQRAFAKKLQLSPGRLSEYLTGKRLMSRRTLERVIALLNLPAEQANELLELHDLATNQSIVSPNLLSLEEFEHLQDWQYFPILALLETKDFQSSISWIAERLGISEKLAHESVDRLLKLGFISKRKGRFVLTFKKISTPNDIPSKPLRDSHKQTLEHLIQSLDQVPPELREVSSITMAIATEKIPEAKKLIRKFKRSMERLLETGERNEVYNLNIQLFPVTKMGNIEKEKQGSLF